MLFAAATMNNDVTFPTPFIISLPGRCLDRFCRLMLAGPFVVTYPVLETRIRLVSTSNPFTIFGTISSLGVNSRTSTKKKRTKAKSKCAQLLIVHLMFNDDNGEYLV